ncbi:MAG TPA: fibronectin type III domain-containing protein [Acidimicrobiales bacterium]|nr:fibronectin type III domain-containing protein [Acidimicrobiales bacterium]
MTTGLRRVALLVVLAVTASLLTLTPQAQAQEQRPGAAPAPGVAEVQAPPPDVANPEIIDPTPTGPGDPVTIGQAGLDSNLDGFAAAGEVVERRTEDSTTVVTEDGTYETTFYDAPVNYQDANGDWQPIDNTLVPADKPGALRNKAGAVEVTLPSEFGTEPVRAAKGDISVAFTLRGRADTPSPSVDTDTSPSGEAMDTPPDGATGTPPAGEATGTPPAGEATGTPPAGEATGTPPAGEATGTSPSGEATGTSPSGEATGTPPAGEATGTPPPGEATGTAPPEVAKRAPSPDVVTDTPSPAVAKRAPSPGLPKGLPAPASEQAAKASATYADALPGVDVSYTATPEGVKEDIVLAGPDSPTSFDFTVEASKGLTATETLAGGIDFVDGAGEAKASFAPPFAYDADFHAAGSESSFTEDAVSLRIVETTPQLVVRLAADPAWLAAPERAWPVVVDPVLTFEGADADTYLRKAAPDENNGASSRLSVLGGSGARRSLHAKAIKNFFDEPAMLYSATLRLYATTDTSAYSPRPMGAYGITTSPWYSSQATWNRRTDGLAWNTPGGDFRPEPIFVNPNVTGAPGWRSWPITSPAQDWLDGKANLGVLLKYEDEAAGGALTSFASSNEADTTLRPRIVVRWEPLEGVRAPYTHEEFDLGTAGKASVNVASGNLTITDNDLSLAGTGLPTTVDRRYHSRGIYMGSVGARWRMWPQSEERLAYADFRDAYAHNGDIMWHGGPEELLVFSEGEGSFTEANPNGTYISPPGYEGTLALVSEDGRAVFKLTDHDSGTVRNFFSSGYLRDITDPNANKITFGYVYDTANDEYFMASMTDTQGRVTTFERAGEWKVTKMVEPGGRTHVYTYDRADAKANLASYTDPAGKVTRYDYTGSVLGLMSRVTDPGGNATAFTYDSRSRVTSLTRAGQTWRFDYSTPWQTKMTDAQGQLTTYSFDRRGVVTRTLGPPSAPSGLRAVPGDGRAALSWEASNPNGSPVSGYTLTASPGGATTTVPGDAGSAMFEGLTNGTAYTFTAVATNAVGDSAASLPSNEVTPSSDRSLLSPLVDPTNVVATRGDTTATVTWDRPLVTLPLLTTFEVTTYRASDGAELGTTDARTNDSVTVTGLKNGTPVYFTVTAKSLLLSGTSEPSNTVTPAGPPFAPTDVAATRGDRQVEVSWSPPGPREDGTPGDNGEPISGYTITAFRADDNTEVSTTEASASPMIVGGLVNGTAYYFTVHATNEVGPGQKSAPSNAVTPAGAPFAPVDVTATTAGNGEARVSWSPPPTQPDGTPGDNGDPIISYTLRAQPGGPSVTVDSTTTSVDMGGLEPGTSYTFTVSATNGVGESPRSAPSNSVAIIGPPDPPTWVIAEVDGEAATVSWMPPARLNGSTLTGYIVTATPAAGGGSEVTVTVADPAATSTNVSGLVGGTTYEFRVVATSDRGNSRPSEAATGTPAGEPGAPSAVRAMPGDGHVRLTWTAPSDAGGSMITGYEVSVTPACSPACIGLATVGPATTVSGGLTNTTVYTFRVRAVSTAGPGPYSAAVEAIPHRPTYVAMGDSYSAGVGAAGGGRTEEEDMLCNRSDRAYGPVYSEMQGANDDLVFLACGGAVTGHPRSPGAGEAGGLQPIQRFVGEGGQISRLPVYADLVSFTIGGNDVGAGGFGRVIEECVTGFDPCHQTYGPGQPDDVQAEIEAMRTILPQVYREVLARAPNARVVVFNYPQIIKVSDLCVPTIVESERRWIRQRFAQLAGVINDAEQEVGSSRLTLIDVLGDFADANHGPCENEEADRYVNGVVPGNLGSSFHPTTAGYRHEAEKLLAHAGSVVR